MPQCNLHPQAAYCGWNSLLGAPLTLYRPIVNVPYASTRGSMKLTTLSAIEAAVDFAAITQVYGAIWAISVYFGAVLKRRMLGKTSAISFPCAIEGVVAVSIIGLYAHSLARGWAWYWRAARWLVLCDRWSSNKLLACVVALASPAIARSDTIMILLVKFGVNPWKLS